MIVATPMPVPALAPLDQALATLRRHRGGAATRGLTPGLSVPAGAPGWLPASALLDPADRADHPLDRLFTIAAERWRAAPHVAASLAWRSYTYWLTLPAVLAFTTARRVLRVDPHDVLLRIEPDDRLLQLGLRRTRWLVLPDDPLAAVAEHPPTDDAPANPPEVRPTGEPTVRIVDSETDLLAGLRHTLRTEHLDPLLQRVRELARTGTRPLLGSLAAAVGYAVVRGVSAPADEQQATAGTLLDALGLADLVELVPGADGPTVQRRTCCLAFTLPEGKVCTGCCLRQPAGSGR